MLPERDEHRLELGVLVGSGLRYGQRSARGLHCSFSMSARMRSRWDVICAVFSSNGSHDVVGFTSLRISRCFLKRL